MILDELAAYARKRVELDKENISLEEMRELATCVSGDPFVFEQALRKEKPAFICEVKKASPSKGVIAKEFPYVEIAKTYEQVGATCISVLTEPKWFLGSDTIFKEVREAVSIPMIRKDFTVDEYQIYQSKMMGADCILLICALLNGDTIAHYLELCHKLGMSALVETHDEAEIQMAVDVGATLIGVNNRNLKDFTVNLNNASKLQELIPEHVCYIAESGIATPRDGSALVKKGAHGLLIGEALMRSGDKGSFLQEIKRGCL